MNLVNLNEDLQACILQHCDIQYVFNFILSCKKICENRKYFVKNAKNVDVFEKIFQKDLLETIFKSNDKSFIFIPNHKNVSLDILYNNDFILQSFNHYIMNDDNKKEKAKFNIMKMFHKRLSKENTFISCEMSKIMSNRMTRSIFSNTSNWDTLGINIYPIYEVLYHVKYKKFMKVYDILKIGLDTNLNEKMSSKDLTVKYSMTIIYLISSSLSILDVKFASLYHLLFMIVIQSIAIDYLIKNYKKHGTKMNDTVCMISTYIKQFQDLLDDKYIYSVSRHIPKYLRNFLLKQYEELKKLE